LLFGEREHDKKQDLGELDHSLRHRGYGVRVARGVIGRLGHVESLDHAILRQKSEPLAAAARRERGERGGIG
jgi:hypothetical protein